MKSSFYLSLLLSLILVIPAAGQRPGGGSGGGGGRPTGGTSSGNGSLRLPSPDLQPSPVFISGKVVVDDGSELTDQALIQTTCKGRRHIEGYTDSHGNFNVELGRRNNFVGQEIDSDMGPSSGMLSRSQNGRQWNDCELQAILPGFTSQVVELGTVNQEQNANIGRVVLHRLAHVEGFTLSATTAAAPENAKKAYAKGRELAEKKKWDKAEEKLQEAVRTYSQYAIAWYELGRVQLQRDHTTAARASFTHAIEADSKLVTPHQQLARMAFNEKKWQEVIDQTQQVLSLNPISFPQDWFLNAAANYLLRKYDDAENSARKGLKADLEGAIPKLEYVLGLALLQKHDLAGAQEHMKNYIHRAPNDPEVPKVQEQLAMLEKALGAPPPAAANAPRN
jgi:tetratricopeptide (TPR) repeat protein